MVNLNVKLTLLSMILLPLLVVFTIVFFQNVKRTFKEYDEAEGKMSAVLQENLNGVRVVKAFAKEKYEIEKYNNPYKLAIESALFFLDYINKNILQKNLIDVAIYNEFDKFVINHIEEIVFNKEQCLFELYIYEWLKKEKYIHEFNNINNYFKHEDLTQFYNKYHRKILDWIIRNDNNLKQFNPLNNTKHVVYYNLFLQYNKISQQNIVEK